MKSLLTDSLVVAVVTLLVSAAACSQDLIETGAQSSIGLCVGYELTRLVDSWHLNMTGYSHLILL